MALTLTLDSAFLVLTLRGKSFTLTAPEASTTLGGEETSSSSGGTTRRTRKTRVHWKYHETYDKAFDLGTLSDAVAVIEEVAAMLPPPPPSTRGLIEQWNEVKAKFNQLPVLANAAENVLETIEHTSVKITDVALELDLTTVTETTGSSTTVTTRGSGAFTLGLAFTPAVDHPIRLFALGITAFGAVLGVKLDKLKLVAATAPASGSLAFEN